MVADLLRHGLLRPSFVPDRPQRELRELTRYRASLVQGRTTEVNRLQKTLEGANIKLTSVATDIMGVSAQAMLRELLEGNTDTAAIAELAKGRLRKKLSELEQALTGQMRSHHRFMVARQLGHIDSLDELIAEVDAEIEERMRPFDEEIQLLDTIPGINRLAAQGILAEIGTDMTRFRTHAHFSSWAKLCPGNNESAGKRKSSRTGKGNPWLRRLVVQVARAAARKKDSYLSAQYRRIAARRGANRAAIAVAHSILIIIYYLLQRRCTYSELGGNYFDERDREATVRSLTSRLENLGYKVTKAA
jgi:transposase